MTSCSLKIGMPTDNLTAAPALKIDHGPQSSTEDVGLGNDRLEGRAEKLAPALDRSGVSAAIELRHQPRQRQVRRQHELEDVHAPVRRE